MRRNQISMLAFLLVPLLAGPTRPQAKKAVAVLQYENNTGDAQYDNLGRALSTMMMSDLSVVDEIQLVERDRIEDITKELQLQNSGYVDPATAQSLGQIVGAEYVVTGDFSTIDPEMHLDTRIVRVATSEVVKTAQVTGQKNQLFDLQQQLADQFMDGLSVVLTEEDRARLREQQEANRIDDLETMVAFSQALCLMDNGYYVDAFDKMQEVHDRAPGSHLVQLTFDQLKEKAGDEAKNQLKEQAGKALGGLFGRKAPKPKRDARSSGC